MYDAIIVLTCLAAIVGGLLISFAYAMSDVPSDSKKADFPLIVAALGLLGVIVEIVRLLAHWIHL